MIDFELRKRGDEPDKAANWPMGGGYSEICHEKLLTVELKVGLNSSVRKKIRCFVKLANENESALGYKEIRAVSMNMVMSSDWLTCC